MGDVPQSSTPQHVAVIMDGNGRWAESRGLPRKAGHRAGAESVREAADACLDLGIKFLTLYAFSSENWNRPEKEIDALMKLLEQFLKSKGKEFAKKNVRLRTIGRTQMLPDSCRAQLDKVKADTANNTALTVILALSYGSRHPKNRAKGRKRTTGPGRHFTRDRRLTPRHCRLPRPGSPYPHIRRTTAL